MQAFSLMHSSSILVRLPTLEHLCIYADISVICQTLLLEMLLVIVSFISIKIVGNKTFYICN